MRNFQSVDLQLFGANEALHGTEAFINSNTNTTEGYVSQAGSENGLSAEMKTFYDKALIELATPNLVHCQFGQKRPIPVNGGKTIEFRRMKPLAKSLTSITEGITPTGSKMTVVPMTTTVSQYGDYIEQTDLLEMTSVDNTIVEATKLLADQAGRTLDTVVRDVLQTGTNVNYCSAFNGSSYVSVDSRAKLDETAKLRVVDVFKAAAQLKAVNAPAIEGKYIAIIHPHVAFDLMQESGDAWVDIKKYAEPEKILNGELGTLGGVRFVESSEAKINYGSDLSEGSRTLTPTAYSSSATGGTVSDNGGSATAYRLTVSEAVSTELVGRVLQYYDASADICVNFKVAGVNTSSKYIFAENDIGVTYASGDLLYPGEGGKKGIATYSTIFLGSDAYGIVDINGSGSVEHIVKQRGYGNDPLNQRSSIGWKALMAAAILSDDYILRVESGSTFSGDVSSAN